MGTYRTQQNLRLHYTAHIFSQCWRIYKPTVYGSLMFQHLNILPFQKTLCASVLWLSSVQPCKSVRVWNSFSQVLRQSQRVQHRMRRLVTLWQMVRSWMNHFIHICPSKCSHTSYVCPIAHTDVPLLCCAISCRNSCISKSKLLNLWGLNHMCCFFYKFVFFWGVLVLCWQPDRVRVVSVSLLLVIPLYSVHLRKAEGI